MGFSNTWKSLKRPHIMMLIDFAALPTKNSPSFCWDPQVKRLRKHEETVISNHQIRGGQISLQLYWNMSSHMWKKTHFYALLQFVSKWPAQRGSSVANISERNKAGTDEQLELREVA